MEWRDCTTTSARSGFRVTAGYITREIATSDCGGRDSHELQQEKLDFQRYRFGQGPSAHAWIQRNETPEDAAVRSLAFFIGMNLSANGIGANADTERAKRAKLRALFFASELERFAEALEASNVLHAFEVIGSSVLLYYDVSFDPAANSGGVCGNGKIGLKWIDFSHAIVKPSPEDIEAAGMRQNNVLMGVRNLASLLRSLVVKGARAEHATISNETHLREYRHKWDSIYNSSEAQDHEWHSTWDSIATTVAPYLDCITGSSARVLDIGCGTSSLGLELCQAHPGKFERLSLLDASPVCIDMLRERYGHQNSNGDGGGGGTQNRLPEIVCVVGDCRRLPYKDGSVHVLLDKGTLDALDNDMDNLAMLTECRRVMVPDCGVLLSISFGAANRLRFFAKELPGLGMRNDVYTLSSARSDAATVFLNAIYVVGSGGGTRVPYSPDARTRTVISRALDVNLQDEDPDASFSAEASEQLAGVFGNDSESDFESD